ncbi:MAG: EMC3/TMCO1 family protein [Candidatus Woesearchaeota archaeon]
MSFLDFLNPVFDFLFGWLLLMTPFWSILILSFIMSFIVIIITKYTTDQDLMKHLKEESKELQKQMKELKDQPEKMMEVQKKHMQSSMKYMSQSFRPMIFTFIPIIIIFGWISAHLAYEPIMPGQEFSVKVQLEKGLQGVIVNATAPEGITLTSNASKEVSDGFAIFTFKGDAGDYSSPSLMFNVNGKEYYKEVKITTKREYVNPIKPIRDGTVKQIETIHEKVKVIKLGNFSLSWIWSYIIFSIIFSSILRKWLKVY